MLIERWTFVFVARAFLRRMYNSVTATLKPILYLLPLTALAQAPPEVQQILEKACLVCHGAGQQLGGLRLDNPNAAVKLIAPGNPDASLLYQRNTGAEASSSYRLDSTPSRAVLALMSK